MDKLFNFLGRKNAIDSKVEKTIEKIVCNDKRTHNKNGETAIYQHKPSDVIVDRKIVDIEINKLTPNKNQPRKIFEESEIKSLGESIKENGIIQPIVVREISQNQYEIVAGERRFRASQLLGFDKIPSIVIDVTEYQSAVLALIENIQRRDLTFFEEAEALRCILKEGNMTQEQLSLQIGKSQSTIANKLRLLTLPNNIKLLILQNNITERHSRALLKIPCDSLKEVILKEIIEQKLNVEQSEKLIESYSKNKKTKKRVSQLFIVKDVRIFLNTINKAIDIMKTAGIDAKVEQKEKDDYIIYQIKIPTKGNKRNVGRKIS